MYIYVTNKPQFLLFIVNLYYYNSQQQQQYTHI